jgi:hypothetical protein
MTTQAELDELAELEALMGDIGDDEMIAQELVRAEQEALAQANPEFAKEISEQQASENMKRKIAENKRLAAEKRQAKEDAQMEEYLRKEAEVANATTNMAERIAQRKRELAEKKSKRGRRSNGKVCTRGTKPSSCSTSYGRENCCA